MVARRGSAGCALGACPSGAAGAFTEQLERLTAALADHYTIERELGQGGMATVYLAEDLRHHRQVALKVLRPEIAATLGAGRFAREIEVAARLQHPNILPLLDSGEAAGFFFYVMPYVEGESLRDRLARGGELPIHDAVRILMEVADALSEAHAHGVVHRDIKPDNVMLRGRHALVTDFGVAKAVTEATGRQILTSAGVALGTPAYMAPEQATADPHQDHRVDIYALGVLGYELLTGRAPFSATTAQEMLAAHVTAEPEPLEQYRPTVSPVLAQVVMKCLAKKPADRWQTADELLTALEPLATPSGGTTPTQTRPATAGRLPRWAKWAAGVAALALVVLVVGQVAKPKPLNITLSDITQITSESGVQFQPAVSPDGNEVAYVAGPIGAPHLTIRSTANIAGGGEVRLADTSAGGEWYPAWSPDGALVRFQGCRGTAFAGCDWYETGRLGGSVRRITLPPRARSPAWSPNGARVAFFVGDTLFTASASAADTAARPVAVDTAAWRYGQHSLTWSPDAKLLAYVSANPTWQYSGNVNPSTIRIVNAEGGSPRTIAADAHLNVSPVWLDARHLLFVSDRDGPRGVYVVEVGPAGRRGDPRAVPGVADPHSVSYAIGTRTLAFAKLTLHQNIWSYPLGRSAPMSIRDGHPVTTGNQVIECHDVSPDGKWIVYDDNLRGNQDLYKMRVDGGQAVPVTNYPGDEAAPRWSPDGREIVFYTGDSVNTGEIEVVPAVGGAPVLLSASHGTFSNYPRWSRDGLAIFFWSDRTGRPRDWILTRDSVGGAWHEAVMFADVDAHGDGEWAPDGSGVLESWNLGSMPQVISDGGHVIWRRDLTAAYGLTVPLHGVPVYHYSRDGRTIYVWAVHRDGRQGIWAIPVAGGAARLVVAYDDPAFPAPIYFSVGPDRLYLTVSQYESNIWVAQLHW